MSGERIAIYLTSMQLGGAQRVALNLCTGLVERDYDVNLVLVKAEGELLEELPDEVSVVDLGEDRVATTVLPLRNYLRHTELDVFYAMMTEINVISTIAHRLARSDARLVISEHNMPTNSATSTKDEAVLKAASWCYPLADQAVAVSRGVHDDLIDVSRLSSDDVSVIHNPLVIEEIRAKATEPLEHRWLTESDCPVVMSAGRHADVKGFDTLLNAFAEIENTDAKLVLLGKGELTDDLRELATDLDVASRVEFTGFVENPFQYMAHADAFVLSSRYEGFGMVLVEAMACGSPVVSTDCPSGPAEILQDGTYGPLVPVDSPEEMATAIENTLASPVGYEFLEARANEFSVDSIADEYEAVFFPGKEFTFDEETIPSGEEPTPTSERDRVSRQQ